MLPWRPAPSATARHRGVPLALIAILRTALYQRGLRMRQVRRGGKDDFRGRPPCLPLSWAIPSPSTKGAANSASNSLTPSPCRPSASRSDARQRRPDDRAAAERPDVPERAEHRHRGDDPERQVAVAIAQQAEKWRPRQGPEVPRDGDRGEEAGARRQARDLALHPARLGHVRGPAALRPEATHRPEDD